MASANNSGVSGQYQFLVGTEPAPTASVSSFSIDASGNPVFSVNGGAFAPLGGGGTGTLDVVANAGALAGNAAFTVPSGKTVSFNYAGTLADFSITGTGLILDAGVGGGSGNIFIGEGDNGAAGNAGVTGGDNIGIGGGALHSLTTGGENIAGGARALYQVTSGTQNSAWGEDSGFGIIAGSQNSFLGFESNCSGDYSNSTAIGSLATCTASNQVMLGNTNVTQVVTSGAGTFGSRLTSTANAASVGAGDVRGNRAE